jgi:L-threonylcarbamoyladenylate synthase
LSKAILQKADAAGIARAAETLCRGGLAAFPTETVYGLGADATNGKAVAAIFAAKQRPSFNPLIVHVPDVDQARRHAEFSPLALKLAAAFWPGALTLVLPRRSDCALSLLVSAGLDSVALRVPVHKIAHALLVEAGVPVAAPSANPSGRVSPTTAAHVMEGLGARIDFILDGGPTPLGIESTVIGFADDAPVLLRPGALTREAIEAVAGPLRTAPGGAVSSPGQLQSHYAPQTGLRLNARQAGTDEVLLGFGPVADATRNLSPRGDLGEAAANLFAMLRALDGPKIIAVSPIPETGLGEAINDRLRRAAAKR